MTLGDLLKKHRLERGLTLEAVALEAGTDPGNLSRIERDTQHPSAPLLQKIAQALGLTAGQLYAQLDAPQNLVQEVPPGYDKSLQQLQKRFLALNPGNRALALEFVKMLGRLQKSD